MRDPVAPEGGREAPPPGARAQKVLWAGAGLGDRGGILGGRVCVERRKSQDDSVMTVNGYMRNLLQFREKRRSLATLTKKKDKDGLFCCLYVGDEILFYLLLNR